MFLADSLNGLTETIVRNIDDPATLNQKQGLLFDLCSARFGLEAGSRCLAKVFL
jgi:hypothetical protein